MRRPAGRHSFGYVKAAAFLVLAVLGVLAGVALAGCGDGSSSATPTITRMLDSQTRSTPTQSSIALPTATTATIASVPAVSTAIVQTPTVTIIETTQAATTTVTEARIRSQRKASIGVPLT